MTIFQPLPMIATNTTTIALVVLAMTASLLAATPAAFAQDVVTNEDNDNFNQAIDIAQTAIVIKEEGTKVNSPSTESINHEATVSNSAEDNDVQVPMMNKGDLINKLAINSQDFQQ